LREAGEATSENRSGPTDHPRGKPINLEASQSDRLVCRDSSKQSTHRAKIALANHFSGKISASLLKAFVSKHPIMLQVNGSSHIRA
jgi:transposase